MKDRIAKYLVEEYESRADSEYILLEPTSGNTGIALAMVSRVKGYKGIDQEKNTFSSLWMRRVK